MNRKWLWWVMPLMLLPLIALGAAGAGYSDDEAVKLAGDLSSKLDVDQAKQHAVHTKLEKWLAHKRDDGKFANMPISGVFAYKLGEGGLVVKMTHGKGLAHFYGEDRDHKIKLTGFSAGATAGGSSETGVGVILGTTSLQSFAGTFGMTQTGAAAVESGGGITELSKKGGAGDKMRVVLLGSSSGLTAGAQGGEITIKLAD
jgi:hypothetical protein